MKKTAAIIAILLSAVMLSGCNESSKQVYYAATPVELKDCKFYELNNSNGNRVQVVRCPNSDTSVQAKQGKATVYSATVEGK